MVSKLVAILLNRKGEEAEAYSAPAFLGFEKPSLNMDTQLIITTNTQPISPVKKMVSTIRVAKTISELAMLVTRAFPKPPKSYEDSSRS